jgi:hypothetical protein
MHASSILDFISAHHESTLTDDLENNLAEMVIPLSRTSQPAKGSIPPQWYAIR